MTPVSLDPALTRLFASDPAGFADFEELLCQNAARVCFLSDEAVSIAVFESGAVLLAAKNPSAARAALDAAPKSSLYCAHGEMCREVILEYTNCNKIEKYKQFAYLKQEPPAAPQGVEMRILDESYADIIAARYHGVDDPEYTRRRVRAGVMLGAFADGALAGFIGTHTERSMGLLEVLPEYRGRGLGYALEAALVRRLLAGGSRPFCHVLDTNEPSLRIQQKLGLSQTDFYIYWLSF